MWHDRPRYLQNRDHVLLSIIAGIFGRKKRQAKIIADPTHEVRCENMLKNSTVCAEYRSKCKSCPQTSNATEGDVIKQGKHVLISLLNHLYKQATLLRETS
jgi:hypothetical protein